MDSFSSRVKVAWEDICLPKEKGGLGLGCTKEWNQVTMTRHIWNIVNKNHKSVQVKWVYANYIKEKSFKDIKPSQGSSRTWRLRNLVRKHIFYKMGNDKNISFWFDN